VLEKPPLGDSEVAYSVENGVARITIDRPWRRNAMSFAVMQGLRDALALAKGDEAVRVAVLTGAGDRAFCTGADLDAIAGVGEEADAKRGVLVGLFQDLWTLGKPTIARVRGYALAGGMGLALCCDFVIAADDAQFGTPEVNVGLWPYIVTVPMLRSMPPRKVLELQMTGRRVGAVEALAIGFVNEVVTVANLDERVDELAAELASKSPLVLRLGRDAFYQALEMDSDPALEYLHNKLNEHTQIADAAEGIAAFAEKRPPMWRGI
jgi:enoyl-CoA hydratase/carnithine racemase